MGENGYKQMSRTIPRDSATTGRLLDGKIAFVTGAAAGLGRAIAERLAAAGARGLAFDIVAAAGVLPPGWLGLQGNVAEEDDVARAVAQIAESFGRLDVVVANAGLVPPWRAIDAIDFEEWDAVFAVNVKGVAATMKHAAGLMQRQGGSIIAMGSLNSHRGHAGQCLYTASKHAVLGIVRTAARDLGRFGIRVNALGPGPVATDALIARVETRARAGGPAPDDAYAEFAAETSLGRMVATGDVAGAALFLASDLSDGISGQLLPVDAGLT